MRARKRRLWTCIVHLTIISFFIVSIGALPDTIKVGGLFEVTEEEQEIAFSYAIDRINADRSILPRSRLSPQIRAIPPHDSFHTSKTVCELLQNGIAAIFGPTSPSTSGLIQSTCDYFEIPHMETRWDYRLYPHRHSLNLFPHPLILSKAFRDLILKNNWKSVTLIYEDNEGLIRQQEVLKATENLHIKITLKQLVPEQSFKKLMKDLGKQGETNFIIDIPLHKIQSLLREAAEVKMMTEYNNYIISSLDLETLNWKNFEIGLTNITGLRLVDPKREVVSQVVQDWIFGELRHGRDIDATFSLKTETALLYDAVTLFAKALHDLDLSQTIQITPLSCLRPSPWTSGNSIVNYMKMIHLEGLSGRIKFDEFGHRVDFELDVVKLRPTGFAKIATWSAAEGIQYKKAAEEFIDGKQIFGNRTLRVTTIVNPPYTMLKEPKDKLQGNDRFEGYSVDLIKEITKIIPFSYEINLVKDGKYGSRNKKGEWNGMIGELINKEADIAVADLTITYLREEAVDFTLPFMHLGISILFKKPTETQPELFSFLAPLSVEVWLYMATAFLGVTLVLFILARFSPYEWENPHPCEEAEVLENQFTLLNSFWFTIGYIMQQGSDLAPRAISTRMIASLWGFFTLIMISSYTANLAAFLTAQRMSSPIESADDLAKQMTIQYGCVKSGSTSAFFENSNVTTYKRMWAMMESTRPSVFTDSNKKGIERVKRGNYAFLMESTSIEYMIARDCDLIQTGGLLDTKGYGIATPIGSPYRTFLSNAVLKLQEEGKLEVLKTLWWKQKGSLDCGDDGKSSSSASSMTVANVGGVFVVLVIGVVISIFIVILEFFWKAHKNLERDVPVTVMMFRELKRIVMCGGSSRPVPKEEEPDSPFEKIQMTPVDNIDRTSPPDRFS